MKTLSVILFWLGIVSIPLTWVVWYFGPELTVGRQVIEDIADPALRAAMQEAHAERLGLWVAVWPVTLLVLSSVVAKRPWSSSQVGDQ